GALLAVFRAAAVDRGRRGVQERHLLVLAPLQEPPRIGVVVVHHEAPVGLHRVGAGTLVQHRLHRALQRLEARGQFRLVDVIGDLATGQVLELVGVRQVVDGDDLGDAAAVEPLDELRADEACGTGDDVVVHFPKISAGVTTAVPNLVTLMPPARLAMRTADSSPSPAASITASVAMTVSPAPVTSETSCFSALTWIFWRCLKSVMPLSPRVRSNASSRS